MKKLNGNIVQARRAVDSAVEELSTYLEDVNRLHDPIQRLPVELACYIFLLCLPRLQSRDIFDVSHATMADYALRPIPLLLGSICRYWRRVVWASPQLWNILWLHVTPQATMARSRMLTEWLTRSGQLPLYVCMFCHQPQQYHYHDDKFAKARNSIYHMIDTLTCYAGRIKILHLQLDALCISRFGRPTHMVATESIMESLFIQVERYHGHPDWPYDQLDYPSVQTMFSLVRRPSPTHVSFVGIDFKQISIRWENVTSIEAASCRPSEALEILRLVQQLRRFKFGIASRDCELVYGRVTHLALTTLDIVDNVDSKFFDCITCPALENFSYCKVDAITAVCLVLLFNRSACPLKHFTIKGEDIFDLVNVLRVTPLLTHLSFMECRSVNPTLESFNFIRTLCSQKRGGSTPIEELFLRNLCSLSFSILLDGSCMFAISSIISHLRKVVSPQKMSLRPLLRIRVEVVLSTDVANVWNSGENVGDYVIDHDSLVRIMELGEDGVEIEVIDTEGLDLILLSQHFYEMF